MRFVEILGGLAALVAISGVVWYVSRWTGEIDSQLSEIRNTISLTSTENAKLKKDVLGLQAKIANIENHIDSRQHYPSTASVEEVAAILARDYSDQLRGAKGEKGNTGPVGPKGEAGENTDTSPSKAMQVIDFSQVSSGIRVDGIEWGTPSCKRNSSKVTCEALLRNDSGEDDSSYNVYLTKWNSDTRAFTDVLTQNSVSGLTSNSWSKKYDGRVQFKFPSGIIYPLQWDILDVPKDASGFTRMDIKVEGGIVKYENVPIAN